MEQNEYKIRKDCFFKSYKSFIDFVSITHSDYSMYSILVLKKPTFNDLSKVSVIIRNCYDANGTENEYACNVILTHEDASKLIDNIREDFRDNHYITYSTVNERTLVQTLQNTNFSLNIKLNNENEYQKAYIFNKNINNNIERHKVLIRK